mgnify:CR=1 FL=1
MVKTGLHELLEDPSVIDSAATVGLLGHPASVDRHVVHAIKRVQERCGSKLQVLLGPEHGLRGEAQDMEAVSQHRDPLTGLPVVSLYGVDEGSLSPAREALEGVDVLVADLQDVGSRYYTYIWTLIRCLEVAQGTDTHVVVCDRPNPIGGVHVEGPGIQAGFHSFVGGHDVAVRHGMTIGELCRLVAHERKLDVELTVVPMEGWSREMSFRHTGLPWVLPSPNMPTEDTALVYPGGCLVEATQLSEGRGTTRPFELLGAEFVDPHRLTDLLHGLKLPGVRFRPVYFKPTFQKLAQVVCGGIQQHVMDPESYRPYLTGVAFLWAVHRLWPDSFRWRDKPYEFVTSIPAVDLLSGSPHLREALEGGAELPEIQAMWAEQEAEFRIRREPHLLY